MTNLQEKYQAACSKLFGSFNMEIVYKTDRFLYLFGSPYTDDRNKVPSYIRHLILGQFLIKSLWAEDYPAYDKSAEEVAYYLKTHEVLIPAFLSVEDMTESLAWKWMSLDTSGLSDSNKIEIRNLINDVILSGNVLSMEDTVLGYLDNMK